MNAHVQVRHWLAPWITALLAVLYVGELWREGALTHFAGALVQLVVAAPLIVAAGVLSSVLEQQLRIHSISPPLRRWLLWTPRGLLALLVVFLALLSLDVFVEGRSAADIAVGLLMHNLPALGLLAAGVAAWRWPWVGGLALVGFAAWWLAVFSDQGFFPSAFLPLAVLPIIVAALFLLSWRVGATAGEHSRSRA